MDTTYSDVGGDAPYPQAPRRKKSADPLLDELMSMNDVSPSAPKLPPLERTPQDGGPVSANLTNDQGPTPVDPNNTGGLPPDPYPPVQPEPLPPEQPAPSPTPSTTPPPASTPTDVGHDGTYNGMSREQWRDSWMRNTGVMTREQVDAWMAANGAVKVSDNGTFRTPYGETLDLGTAYRSGRVTAGWTPVGGSGGGSGSGGSGGGSGAGGNGWQNDELHQMLMHEILGLQGPVDPNDPRIQNQVTSFRNEQSRASQAARSALAERANFNGASSGFLDSGIQAGIEQAGLNTAKFEGQLTADEYENRRNELDRLLQMAISSSDSAAARDLQAEISRLDREQQNSQFYDTMGYNINRDQNMLDYYMAQLLMGGGN